MLILLSPSKTQDYAGPLTFKKYSLPRFLDDTRELVRELRKFSVGGIEKLMGVSWKIADLNRERFKNFQKTFSLKNSRQAILAYIGHVYMDIDVENYSPKDFEFAQKHVRILTGMYGVLRPLDLIQPYRLEFRIVLKTKRGKNLYEFWNRKVTDLVAADLREQGDDVIINLASEEYFQVIKPELLEAKIIQPIFKEHRNGQYKIFGLLAKRARGMMTDFVIKERLSKPEELKTFNTGGYRFRKEFSNDHEFVFVR